MEIQFQQKVKVKSSKVKAARNNKFIGVRQRPSGRWVAEIKDTTQKIRMWLGTFESAEEAARAYDEAACLLRGSNTRTNFVARVSSNSNSALASRIRGLLNSKRSKKQESTAAPHHHHHHHHYHSITNNSSTTSTTPSSTTTAAAAATHHHHDIDVDVEIDIDSRTPLLSDDDVYKPDLSSCFEFDSSSQSWGFDLCEPAAALELPKNAMELTEFERIKVERQISASLYAINGLHDYMETVYDPTHESFWDLPPLCSLLT